MMKSPITGSDSKCTKRLFAIRLAVVIAHCFVYAMCALSFLLVFAESAFSSITTKQTSDVESHGAAYDIITVNPIELTHTNPHPVGIYISTRWFNDGPHYFSTREINRQGNDFIVEVDGFVERPTGHPDVFASGHHQNRLRIDLGTLEPNTYSIRFKLYTEGKLKSETSPYELKVRGIVNMTPREYYEFFYGYQERHRAGSRLPPGFNLIHKFKEISRANPSDYYSSLVLFREMDYHEYLAFMYALPDGKRNTVKSQHRFSKVWGVYYGDCDVLLEGGTSRLDYGNAYVVCNTNNKPIIQSWLTGTGDMVACSTVYDLNRDSLILVGTQNCTAASDSGEIDQFAYYDITTRNAELTHTTPYVDTFLVLILSVFLVLGLQIFGVIVAMIGFSTVVIKKGLVFRGAPVWRFTTRLASNIILVSYLVIALVIVLLVGLLPILVH
jgi:hypothetical protein